MALLLYWHFLPNPEVNENRCMTSARTVAHPVFIYAIDAK